MTAMLATRDPAVAAAMGRCLAARSFQYRLTRQHPRPCGWCDYPAEELQAGVEAFKAWAEFDDRRSTSGHHEVRMFAELNRDEQEALVVAAQAFEEVQPIVVEAAPSATTPVVPLQPTAVNAIAGESGPRRDVAEPRRGVTTRPMPPTQQQPQEEYLPWKR